ncbi:MAG: RDD family protein [Microbacteriaceae bacterium]
MATPSRVDAVAHFESENELMTGEAVALDLRPASFVIRAAGSAIDFLVYMGAYIAILIPLILGVFNTDEATTRALATAFFVVALVVIPTAVELASRGKSLGRLALGTRIVRDDGGAIGFRHAFIRALVGVLEIFMTLGGFASLVALLSQRSKRLGDYVAGTYSQYERISGEVAPVFGVPVPLQQWALTADVARMPDRLARRIAQFLGHAPSLTPTTRDRLSRELASEAALFVSPIPQANAELFLAAVATLRRDREFTALTLERQGLDRLAPVLEGQPHGFPHRTHDT